MKDENYYIVQGWMVNKLELSGSDLICYAIIYGFSQNESSEFTGSLNYIASFMACSKKTVQRSIDNLISKKLIAKRTETINNVQVNHFSVNMDAINGYSQNDHGMDNLTTGYSQNDHGGMVKMTTNNNSNNEYISIGKKDISSSSDPDISKESELDIPFDIPEKQDKPKKKRFEGVNPSVEEVRAYIAEKGYHFSAEEIVRYYTTDGEKKVWKFSNGSLVRDWKRCCVTFEQRHLERYGNQPARASGSISSARSNDDYYQRVKESEEEYYKRMEEEIRNGTARNLF